MYECEWPASHVRHDPIRDCFVVSRDLNLGDAQVWVNQSIRMRNADAEHGGRARIGLADSRGFAAPWCSVRNGRARRPVGTKTFDALIFGYYEGD